MKTSILISTVAFCAALIALSGCSSSLSYQEAMNKNRKSLESMERLEDANFLVEARSFNLLEKKVNELAQEKGYSADLVRYSKSEFEEQSKLEKALLKVARKEKIRVPGEMKTEHERLYQDLVSSARSEFDDRYVDILERVNAEHANLFAEQASEAHDTEIRAFAARELGMLRANKDDLAKMEDQLMRTHR